MMDAAGVRNRRLCSENYALSAIRANEPSISSRTFLFIYGQFQTFSLLIRNPEEDRCEVRRNACGRGLMEPRPHWTFLSSRTRDQQIWLTVGPRGGLRT